VAKNTSGRPSAIDRRTTRHPGSAVSQRIRKRIEEAFGWIKTIAGRRRARLPGLPKFHWSLTFAASAVCGGIGQRRRSRPLSRMA